MIPDITVMRLGARIIILKMAGLRDIIADKFKDMTRQEIINLLAPWNIPSGPGLTVQDAFEDEHLNSRNMVLDVEDKTIGRIRMPGIPIKISGVDDRAVKSAPKLGEDTAKIAEEFGYDKNKLKEMSEKGVVMCERSDL